MRNLMADGEVDLNDFISRADVLATIGHTVMISDFVEYYRLANYLFRYTNRRVGLAMGGTSLLDIFDESYYANLDGGILESFGRLFKNNLKLSIYPYLDPRSHQLITIDTLEVAANLRQLFGYLVERRYIVQLSDINHDYLEIYSPYVLKKIGADNTEWEAMVPPRVAEAIKTGGLFGYS